jgi:hypothetical protein
VPLPTAFSNNKNPTGPQLDADLLAVAAMGATLCTASGGPNAWTLTPNANQPDVTSYTNFQRFIFVPSAASTGAVTAQINALGFAPVYVSASQQAGLGTLAAGVPVGLLFLQSLNAGSGGFFIYTNVNTLTATILRGFIGGLALSNDGSTPNSVIDVAAGICADSTAATYIALTAFTKSTAGAWVAGSGGNGMGTALTVGASTWYFAFAIINNGLPDVYFDTSITAANKPTNTTSFRRIGSFKTDGSSHILAFTQIGTGSTRQYAWTVATLDVNADTALSNTLKLYTINVPLGIKVIADISVLAKCTTVQGFYVVSPDTTTVSGVGDLNNSVANVNTAAPKQVRTNTAQQIAMQSTAAANNTVSIGTNGWTDFV